VVFTRLPRSGAVSRKETCPLNPYDNQNVTLPSDWQREFETMFPELQGRLRKKFEQLDTDAREEAVDEAVVHSTIAYARLHRQGRTCVATPRSLAYYSARQVRCGRPAVGRMNRRDVLSRYAQLGHKFDIDRSQGQWIDEILLDKRAQVADLVAARLDVRAWWETLTGRLKQIAKDLAVGCTTSEVAKRYELSPGRISQLRRLLELSWIKFESGKVA
jgi:hypothetical protein